MGEAGAAPTQRLTSWCRGREVCLRSDMADISQNSIVTYERKPGHWPAAIFPKAQIGSVGGETVLCVVTPDDSASEA